MCALHRRFRNSSTGIDAQYDEGIIFWTSNGTEIVNFPKQHSGNCSNKHQNTNQRFKRMVRVYKNMRNRMIDDHYIAEGVAPSYFLEGMLWNVPASHFGQGYETSFVNTFNWVLNTDKTQLACANDKHWLVRDNANVCWSTANFNAYLAAARSSGTTGAHRQNVLAGRSESGRNRYKAAKPHGTREMSGAIGERAT